MSKNSYARFHVQFWKYFKNFLVIFFYSNVYEKACKNMREVLGKYVERFLVKLTQTGLTFP